MTPYHTYTDEELILLLKSGEKGAFDEIYNRYWDKLFVTACHRMGNAVEAEDIVQDVLIRFWKNRNTLFLHASLNTYFAVAIKYEVINRMGKQKRKERYQTSANITEADYSTQQQLDLNVLQQRLAKLVNALPEKCRMVFSLSRDHGLSQKQIAEHLNISENTVESHIKKAIKNLRDGLTHLMLSFLY